MLVKFNKATILGFGEHLIKPGVNDLPAEAVAAMQEDEIIMGKFESGELELIDSPSVKGKKKGAPAPSAAERLASIESEKEAVKLAGETIDMDILGQWLKLDKRVKVRNAIKVQRKKIKDVKFREDDKEEKGEE